MNTPSSTQMPFADLPEGTVTFLFTDIEGSTKLLHALREQATRPEGSARHPSQSGEIIL